MNLVRRCVVALTVLLAIPLYAANPPALLSISPDTVIAGTGGFTLTANGAGFINGAAVTFNGTQVPTTFVSSTRVTANISSSNVLTPGSVPIAVANPGTQASASLTLTILPNSPAITSLSPSTLPMHSSSLNVTVNGQNFASSAVVLVNGFTRTTAYVDSSHLTVTLKPGDVNSPGSLNVRVANPNNQLSNTVTLTVTASVSGPTITLLNPNSVAAGGPGFTLTVVGTNFVSGSSVRLNGSPRVTAFVDSSHLTAQIAANDILNAASIAVTVVNPDSSASSPATLTVTTTPLPVINSISPTTVSVGAAPFTLTISGTNFVSGSTATIGSVTRAATFVNTTTLTVPVQTADVTTVGQVPISVTTPAPKSATSNQVVLYVVATNAPVITSITPQSVQAGSPAFNILVNGSNFLIDDFVQIGGNPRTTTYVSATQLAAAVPASDVAMAGTLDVTVARHDGSAVSAPVVLTIADAAAPSISTFTPATASVGDPAFILTIDGHNFTTSSAVIFDNTVRTTQYVSATELTIPVAAADLTAARGIPVLVVNSDGTTSPVMLFYVVQPVPAITALNPSTVISGGAAFQLQVSGTNFSADSVISVNGSARSTQFDASTGKLTTNITAAEITSPGILTVSVTRNGATSAIVALPVLRPIITSVDPAVIIIGTPSVVLTVRGSGFLSTSKIVFKGSERTTVLNSDGSLSTTIDGTTLTDPGIYAVSVKNSATSLSDPFTVAVQAPGTPRIDSILPATIAVGSGVTSIQVTGGNFVPLSIVAINGADRATAFLASNLLKVTLLPADISVPGKLHVTVRNPDGTKSAEALVTITGQLQTPSRRRVVGH